MEFIPAKTILNKVKWGDKWFGLSYNFNLYRGCPHGCIYCDSRCNYYHIEDFDRVRAKENCLEILEKELSRKREKGIVGIGAMSDAYNPQEKKYELTRRSLELLLKYGYGVSIETKSSMILRDLDILKEINKTQPVIMKMTITTPHDEISRKIEPRVCPSSERFKAVKAMSDVGIFAGIIMDPILPFITDSEQDILEIVRLGSENGAKYIWTYFMAVTLRDNQRLYFYEQLDKSFPGLKEKYLVAFGNKVTCKPLNQYKLRKVFELECEKYGILYKMEDIIREAKNV